VRAFELQIRKTSRMRMSVSGNFGTVLTVPGAGQQ
jgi:hypothetical protein